MQLSHTSWWQRLEELGVTEEEREDIEDGGERACRAVYNLLLMERSCSCSSS